ncbi:MAG: MTH938/NDUFAF3 family protein [Desulfobacterales bacterium]|nr:MTH938/NDUFAF3 family protein [Desulfobacterales bacterium]
MMPDNNISQFDKSPYISRQSWGNIEVDKSITYKDVILYPGGSEAWDWRQTGTSHGSGIQPADVRRLLDKGAKAVVLAKGIFGRLNISEATIQMLKEMNIPYHILKTKAAVRKYNELQKNMPVGGLFHSTC